MKSTPFILTADPWTINDISSLVDTGASIELSACAKEKILHCREYLERTLKDDSRAIYGVNTGFGSLCNMIISVEDLSAHQHRLILSHSAGSGEIVPEDVARLVLLLKIKSFCLGHSGVRLELVDRLVHQYNSGALPVMYHYGSLGASGDLAPLAHLALPLIGEGELSIGGEHTSAQSWLEDQDLQALQLQAKEGLALINGTQLSTGLLLHNYLETRKLSDACLHTSATSLVAYSCALQPYDEDINLVRKQSGQMHVASAIRSLLRGYEQKEVYDVQDPYSFRCVPQVHGAVLDGLAHCEHVLTAEINAVTDNPLIFPEKDKIVSGGNFHAEPIALAADQLAVGLTELMNISERRIFCLLSGQRGLSPYLAVDAGRNSGYMIAQYTIASIVARSRLVAGPASAHTLVSCNGQEDHVSLAVTAAWRNLELVQNLRRVLSTEFLLACQAVDLREGTELPSTLSVAHQRLREHVAYLDGDRQTSIDMETCYDIYDSLWS